jgi:hypothetical protein
MAHLREGNVVWANHASLRFPSQPFTEADMNPASKLARRIAGKHEILRKNYLLLAVNLVANWTKEVGVGPVKIGLLHELIADELVGVHAAIEREFGPICEKAKQLADDADYADLHVLQNDYRGIRLLRQVRGLREALAKLGEKDDEVQKKASRD